LSAEQGNSTAQDQVGVLLSEGRGVPVDFERAIFWTKKAVAQNNAIAAHNLGTIYRDMGRHRTAFRWYKKAVAMGLTSSLVDVGVALLFGIGVKSNPGEACRCFRDVLTRQALSEVSPLDHENARFWLGLSHLQGRGIRKSPRKARECFELADKAQDNAAAQSLLFVLGRATPN
jgi:uncharacterized protein